MARTKTIFAFDKSSFEPIDVKMLEEGAPYFEMAKFGLESMTAENDRGQTVASIGRSFCAVQLRKRVMWDLKLHDVKNTMEKAVLNIRNYPIIAMFTLHASASDEALAAVAETAGDRVLPLAVTVLTDLDDDQCETRFKSDSSSTVKRFAKNAYRFGIRGFVCSAFEAALIRESVEGNVLIVTPAIRPTWAVTKDEQKRITTPTQAARAGADYIVIGRPMSKPPTEIGSVANAGRLIQEELAAA